jgi:hypothetical protein
MPSVCIFFCSVERFIPRRAAAPLGPPTTQPVAHQCSDDVLALGVVECDRGRNWCRARLDRRRQGLEVGEGDLERRPR